MRQWDTKKDFAPNYQGAAKLVFMGWLIAARHPSWRRISRDLWDAVSALLFGLLGIVFGVALLATSPVSFPLLCLAHKLTRRAARLRYIRANRKADADI